MATIQSVIDMVDKINPNAYGNDTKTAWINECEGLVQTKVLLLAVDDIIDYRYSETWRGTGIRFPDTHTMELPSEHAFRAGDGITVSGLTTYSGNNKSSPVVIKSIDGNKLSFADDTFAATGTVGDAGTATVSYDGRNTELIAVKPHDKLYWVYVSAMVDYANGEYTRYANEMAMFNARFSEYMAWFAAVYDPAGRV